MRVTFLGTGTSTGVPVPTCGCKVCRSSDKRDRRLRPSVLLAWDGTNALVDTSTDLREQALTQGLAHLEAVLYTHAHADHIFGLDDLRMYNWVRGGPIPAYGSAATLAAIRRSFWYAFEEVEAGGGKPSVDLHPVEGPFTVAGRTIVPVPLLHGRLPILGYRTGGFAYLTDVSAIPEASYPLLEGLDVLVLSALRLRPHPTHMHLARSLEEAARIGARRTFFTHIAHEMAHAEIAPTLPPGIELAYDGLSVEVA
ncbi:MAG TPA: MBL fold metallo-hydrolase [Candidatus Polarisedimenticolaceae bacterium]|nr:MBL fold metallo-hydrolase [Candidatus Polarisedimenticolaceae bacterium]